MEPQPKRRLRRSPPPPPQHYGPGDRISALPDDMLLQVLVRLRCARAAARTGLLSRRWRGLWPRLPSLTFRDIPAGVIKSALARVPRRTAVSLVEIRLMSSTDGKLDHSRAKSLLRSAARLSPEEIVFVLPPCPTIKRGRAVTMVLPCFHRATSIELDTQLLRVMPSAAGELPVLEMLSISGNIVNLAALLNRCPRLRVLGITFRGVKQGSLEAELTALEAAAALGLTVTRFGIEFDGFDRSHIVDGAHLTSLLRVAARISPHELLFTSRLLCSSQYGDADLPCLHRTTSIEMNLYGSRFTQLPAGEYLALDRLVLKSCTIADLDTMIIRCPRLRVLNVTTDKSARDVSVHSVSLKELDLYVHRDTECRSIHIVTPLLKKLKLSVYGKTNIDVSISAPVVKKVSWRRIYESVPLIFGIWWLQSMSLETTESYKHEDWEGLCSQLPCYNVLSMSISSSYNPLGVAVDFPHEMEKLPVTNFSVFELHINTREHVFGTFVLRLFMVHHIRTNTQKLKIVLSEWFQMSQYSKCLGNCPCDEPKDLRNQSISLTRLEEVEIVNFRGGDQEIDFVTSILGWAPMLRRMIIKLAYESKQNEIGGCALTIYNICLAYPSLNCSIYLSSGKKFSGPLA